MKCDKLVEFRGKRSHEYMASLYGVTQQAWSKWEKGTVKPSVIIMKRIELDSGIPTKSNFFDIFNTETLLKAIKTA
jgi:DNA-binding XRE family transcriptional regulator